MSIVLVTVGGFFALLFILMTVIRAVQGREKISFFETLLAFLALTLPLVALVNNNDSEQSLTLVSRAPIGIAAVIMVVSLMTLLIEWRKSERAFNQRRGVLGIGVGVLLIAATQIVPLSSGLAASRLDAFAARSNAEMAGNVPASSESLVNVADSVDSNENQLMPLMPTNTPGSVALEVSPTPTHVPSVTPTSTNTPYMLVSPTQSTALNEAQPTAAAMMTCFAVVENNLNLRSGPGTDFELLLTIPSGSTLDLSAQSEMSNWWFVQYQGQSGWVSGDYLTLSVSCDELPLRAE